MSLCEYQTECDDGPRVLFRQRVWRGIYGDRVVFFNRALSYIDRVGRCFRCSSRSGRVW
jgi:hypothetical protein